MSMVGHLEERERSLAQSEEMARRDASAREWMQQHLPPEQRLLKFDLWVRVKLETMLEWKWAGASKTKRIEQCRLELETLALGLWRRGWMLDGQRLAKHITTALADIAVAQQDGRVKDFWPFYKGVIAKYVGLNSEEIQREAMSVGEAMADVFAQLKKRQASVPELVAMRREETLREKQTKARQSEARKAADKQQAQLF